MCPIHSRTAHQRKNQGRRYRLMVCLSCTEKSAHAMRLTKSAAGLTPALDPCFALTAPCQGAVPPLHVSLLLLAMRLPPTTWQLFYFHSRTLHVMGMFLKSMGTTFTLFQYHMPSPVLHCCIPTSSSFSEVTLDLHHFRGE